LLKTVFCPEASAAVFAAVCTYITGRPLIEAGKAGEAGKAAALTAPGNIKTTMALVNNNVAITLKTFFKFCLRYKIFVILILFLALSN